ncbi:MAG: Glucose-1-phosphate cytidylyltransferase, partial [Candidatus Wolfebacteria bacterium GW2011_GWB1_47_243]
GGKPILWHIMKIYAHYGYNEFILALGYRGDMIKEYFLHWRTFLNDFTLDTKTAELTFHNNDCDDFKVTFVETGLNSLTGERVRRLRRHLGGEDFMLTYGDGVGNVNVIKLVEFHQKQGTIGTITGVHKEERFGLISVDDSTGKARDFHQAKVKDFIGGEHADYVNGGFMVFKNEALDLIDPDSMIEHVFIPLAERGELSVFSHGGRWKPMDTQKEVLELNELWECDPFWKVW